jgi:hypothetical protein
MVVVVVFASTANAAEARVKNIAKPIKAVVIALLMFILLSICSLDSTSGMLRMDEEGLSLVNV